MEEEKKEVKKQDTDSTKKVEKNGEKKSKKGIIISVLVIVLVLGAILVYMFLMKDSPRKTIETMLSNLKLGNYSQGMLDTVLEKDFNQEAQKLLFDKLEWKLLNINEEENKATVELEITNKDFKTIIGNYMQRIIKLAFSGANLNEEEMTNYLIEELDNNEIQNITSNQTVVLEKKDGKWEITEENDLVNIILPGFKEAIKSFSN